MFRTFRGYKEEVEGTNSNGKNFFSIFFSQIATQQPLF